MNWRGRPLTSHEVVVNMIAATVTRTGLTVRAGLDPGTYPAGVKVSKAKMDALPLARHDWHGEWNYTLHPAAAASPPRQPPRPARPRHPGPPPAPAPDLAWLCPSGHHRPARRRPRRPDRRPGRPAAALREAALTGAAATAPRQIAPGTGPRPRHTLTAKLAATLLHDHRGLPQKAIAALYQTRPGSHQPPHRRHPPPPDPDREHHRPRPARLATLDDLYRYATGHGIQRPSQDQTSVLITDAHLERHERGTHVVSRRRTGAAAWGSTGPGDPPGTRQHQ